MRSERRYEPTSLMRKLITPVTAPGLVLSDELPADRVPGLHRSRQIVLRRRIADADVAACALPIEDEPGVRS